MKPHCENVVCDVHLTDMKFVHVRHGKGVLTLAHDGFLCSSEGCSRFFGVEGYADLTKDSDFANIRPEPSCSSQHESHRMYIQRTADGLLWVCPVCNADRPYDGAS